MGHKIGIDVGGTFIDFVLINENGTPKLYKALSDPKDLAGAVLGGLETIAQGENDSLGGLLSKTDVIVHGSTVATNALLTKTGAKCALLTTQGFRDVLSMRRGLRVRQLDARQNPPLPLIPRHLRFTVAERVDCEGREVLEINEENLDAVLRKVALHGVEAVAVAFLFSFFSDSHEKLVGQHLRKIMPEVHVSLSSEVLPQVRFYERTSTTVINAYTSPVVARYLEALETSLSQAGFSGRLLIMQSNGGVMDPEMAKKFGARSALSGPAAAPVAGIRYAGLHGLSNLITVDMGGTSFDACLVKDGAPQITSEMEVGDCRLALPMIAVHTIGAGGGSIINVDDRGLIQVGPQSAGASPGPVCYGRGGTQPTVTDADLILGYLDPAYFWGGRLRLNEKSASEAINEYVAQPLGIDTVRAAYGAYTVVNSNMVGAIREVSIRRGYDPREFALVVAGGAGAVHAGAIAKELEIPLVIVPRNAAVFCAMGQLLSDFRHDFLRSYITPLEKIDLRRVNDLYRDMKLEAVRTLISESIPDQRMVFSFYAHFRYIGQFSEIEVPIDEEIWTEETVLKLTNSFHERHESLNGYCVRSAPLEVMSLGVVARGTTEKPKIVEFPVKEKSASSAIKGKRNIFIEDQFMDVPVYDGSKLSPESQFSGPAVVEEETTTLIVPPGYSVSCDKYGNYLVHADGKRVEEVIGTLQEMTVTG